MTDTYGNEENEKWDAYASRPGTASTANTTTRSETDLLEIRPPIPPIPSSTQEEAWRRRSRRRDTLDSRMASNAPPVRPRSDKVDGEVRTARTQSLMTTIRRTEPDIYADLHWEINANNPRNWTKRRKNAHTLFYATLPFPCMFAATTAVALRGTMDTGNLRATRFTVILPVSLYLLGLACGPALSLGSEVLGRRLAHIISIALFSLFILASGLSHTLAELVVFRLLAGAFASPLLLMAWDGLDDMWNPEERTIPLATYIFAILLGPSISSAVAWRHWSQYIILIVIAPWILSASTILETSKTHITRRNSKQSLMAPLTLKAVKSALMKPMAMLFTESIVFLYSLHIALTVAVSYGLYVSLPSVFAQAYGFGPGSGGLTFISMSIGLVLGFAALGLFDGRVYAPRAASYKAQTITEDEKALFATSRPSSRGRSASVVAPQPAAKRRSRSASRPRSQPRQKSRIMQSLARMSGHHSFTPPPDHERDVHMAVAAAKYLNTIPENQGKRIMPERILLLLNQQIEYGHLCQTLEGYKLRFDRIELAKALVEAIPAEMEMSNTRPSSSYGMATRRRSNSGGASSRSASQHRKAAAAALEAREPVPPVPMLPASQSTTPNKRQTWIPPSNVPPPEWRLWGALPASILATASLFMLGWTAQEDIHWLAPVFAMGIFAFSSLITFVSLTLYVLECYGASHGASAVAGSITLTCVFACAFTLFALPMLDALGAGWATSMYAFASVGAGLVPVLLYTAGPKLRRRQKYKERR